MLTAKQTFQKIKQPYENLRVNLAIHKFKKNLRALEENNWVLYEPEQKFANYGGYKQADTIQKYMSPKTIQKCEENNILGVFYEKKDELKKYYKTHDPSPKTNHVSGVWIRAIYKSVPEAIEFYEKNKEAILNIKDPPGYLPIVDRHIYFEILEKNFEVYQNATYKNNDFYSKIVELYKKNMQPLKAVEVALFSPRVEFLPDSRYEGYLLLRDVIFPDKSAVRSKDSKLTKELAFQIFSYLKEETNFGIITRDERKQILDKLRPLFN